MTAGTAAMVAMTAPVVPMLAAVGTGTVWSTAAILINAGLVGALGGLLVLRFGLIARHATRRTADLEARNEALERQARGLDSHAQAMGHQLNEHRERQRDLAYQATHDALTGLPNRALFAQRLDDAVSAIGRHSGMALLMLDLDGFKQVNDTLGHLAGDELLRAVAQRLASVVPPHQTVARLAGDEFAILLTQVRAPAEAQELATAVLAVVSEPYRLTEGPAVVTVSIGVRHLRRFESESAADIMRNADIAMYSAKRSGKNQVSLHAPERVAAAG
jgi:diguanylate cyclase (GGDEF)-like protein